MDPRYVAEFIGTLVLVLVGCGSIALGGFAAGPAGALQVGVAFGLTWTAVTYTIGQSSGAHLNPAITVAMWAAGRANSRDVLRYIVAQCLGAIVGAGILVFVIWAKTGSVSLPTLNLGQNVYGAGYGVTSVLIVELVATIVFALVVLGVTGGGRLASPVAGIVIGFTLIALHVAFFAVDGLSINPARSIGPAVWVRGIALVQLWMFIMVPIMGGAAAGWLYRSKTIG